MKTHWKIALCIGIATIAGCGMMAGGGACDPAIGGLPSINSVTPLSGYAGTLVTISGSGFGEEWEDNHVMIGTVAAQVVTASPTQLEALVGIGAKGGPVSVEVNGSTDSIADNFEILDWPATDSGEDGPPIFFEGHGLGVPLGSAKYKGSAAASKLPSTGQLQVLVIPSYPTDRVPGNLANEKQAITNPWTNVNTFYDQASYGTLDVQITVADWVPLTGTFNDYVLLKGGSPPGVADPKWAPNLRPSVLNRFRAECANGAVNTQGLDLDNYDVMATYIWINGTFIRAWGGVTQSNFAYAGNGLDFNITADHEIWQIALGEIANWGRCAHELGHCLIDAGLVLGEDVYTSGLIDPASATATTLEMMGSHDTHPLYSGEYMYQLGWFSAANITELQWDRNPFSQNYSIVSHRLTQDNDPNQIHLLRIKVNEGLYYYVEARQTPPVGDSQIFDANIPLGATADGGVVVTKVITDEVNNNQEMRFITLLHANATVLGSGEVATDPARGLKIFVNTIYTDTADADRLVCSVTVEWAQSLQPDPNADFDLRIDPWGPGWETPDIWIDREPWNVFDTTDAGGNPTGNGDVPQVGEINHFFGRVHCDGGTDATNVRLTYYSITPPGVGDNGTWTPLDTQEIPLVSAGGQADDNTNWVPIVGEHTCLQVIAEHQAGEVTYGNNKAQENVFEFEPVADSVPDPIKIPLAVRNPLNEPSLVWIHLEGVPQGYKVQLPHHWVYLPAMGHKEMEAIVITLDDIENTQRSVLDLSVTGDIPHSYGDLVGGVYPASRALPIGGFVAKIRPKHRIKLEISQDRERTTSTAIGVKGAMIPGYTDQPVLVVLEGPTGIVSGQTVKTDAQGGFLASFDLTQPPFGGTTQQPSPPASGDYKARAHTIHASAVISVTSNEVSIPFP